MLHKDTRVMDRLMTSMKFKPHKGQQDILDAFSQYRFLCVVCGRRYGKSKIASMTVLYALLERDAKVLCVSKTYKLAKKVWNYVAKDAKKLFGKNIHINKSEMVATTAWGATFELGSADNPDSLLGDGYDVVVVDEAATLNEKIYQQNILPMIRDRKGTILLITTPRGYNWVYNLFELGQQGLEGWWSRRGSAFENKAVYDAEEIELVRKQSDKLYFEQEYLALFRSFASQVYADFSRELHVIDKLPPDFDSWDKYVAIDPGYAQMAAIIFLAYNKVSDEIIIYDEHLGQRMKHDDVLRVLIRKEPKGGYQGIIADVAGKQRTGETGRSFKTYLQEQEWFMKNDYTISSRRYRIISGLNKVRAKLLNVNEEVHFRVLEKCIKCIQGFENYHYKVSGTSDEPDKDGVFDHPMDAIRYFVEYIDKSKRVYEHRDL